MRTATANCLSSSLHRPHLTSSGMPSEFSDIVRATKVPVVVSKWLVEAGSLETEDVAIMASDEKTFDTTIKADLLSKGLHTGGIDT